MESQSMVQRGDMDPSEDRPKPVTVGRRRQLLRLAEEATVWLAEKKIAANELCLFRRMVELMAGQGDY